VDGTERLVLATANKNEAWLSVARVAFCAAILLRLLLLDDTWAPGGVGRLAVESPVLLISIAYSLWAFARARRSALGRLGLAASSAADAVACAASLASNVFFPFAGYEGLLKMIDAAALLPMVMASALRLLPLATIASTAVTAVCFGALVAADAALNGPALRYRGADVAMSFILLAATGCVAALATAALTRLARQAASEAVRVERARSHLEQVELEHHDLVSLVSSLRLALERTPQADAAKGVAHALAAALDGLRAASLAEGSSLAPTVETDLCAVAARCTEAGRARYPALSLTLDAAAPVRAAVAGGERTLTRLLFGLLANAAEGDGTRSAGAVRVSVRRDERHALLEVSDDGPGFPEAVLAQSAAHGVTTKPKGTGVGLFIAWAIAHSSGGSLELVNAPGGGARALLRLPAAA